MTVGKGVEQISFCEGSRHMARDCGALVEKSNRKSGGFHGNNQANVAMGMARRVEAKSFGASGLAWPAWSITIVFPKGG